MLLVCGMPIKGIPYKFPDGTRQRGNDKFVPSESQTHLWAVEAVNTP